MFLYQGIYFVIVDDHDEQRIADLKAEGFTETRGAEAPAEAPADPEAKPEPAPRKTARSAASK